MFCCRDMARACRATGLWMHCIPDAQACCSSAHLGKTELRARINVTAFCRNSRALRPCAPPKDARGRGLCQEFRDQLVECWLIFQEHEMGTRNARRENVQSRVRDVLGDVAL